MTQFQQWMSRTLTQYVVTTPAQVMNSTIPEPTISIWWQSERCLQICLLVGSSKLRCFIVVEQSIFLYLSCKLWKKFERQENPRGTQAEPMCNLIRNPSIQFCTLLVCIYFSSPSLTRRVIFMIWFHPQISV